MNQFWFDGLFIYRRLKRDLQFVAAVLFSLGLGIGLSTATFSVINAVLLRPFPYRQPDQLAIMWGSTSWHVRPSVDRIDIEDWLSRSRHVADRAFFQLNPISFTVDNGDVVTGGIVAPRTFSLLGVSPFLGRGFLEGDQAADSDAVVISHAAWSSRFAADPAVIGRSLHLNGRPHTVIGVMPADFFFPDQYFQLWIPLHDPITPAHVLVRLRNGATMDDARADLDGWRRFRKSTSDERVLWPGIYALHSVVVSRYQVALGTLFGAVVLLLLIASANAANLLLARGMAKARELAVCATLGASPRRVFRLLLMESLILGVTGGALGVLCALGALKALRGLQLTDVFRFEASGIDGRVLIFALGVSMVSGVLAGLWPAWKAARVDLLSSLQMASGGTPSPSHAQVRDLLVASESGLALLLLIVAGLLTNSFVRLVRANWGFDPNHLLAVEVAMSSSGERARAHWATMAEKVSDRLSRESSVSSFALAFGIPIRYRYREVPIALKGQRINMDPPTVCWTVGSGYFRTMGIPFLRGRDFGAQDAAGAERVVVVSKELASRLWPGQDPIGEELQVLRLRDHIQERLRAARTPFLDRATARSRDSWEPDGAPWRVIGEVGGVRAFGLDVELSPALYVHYRQDPAPLGSRGFFVARSSGDLARTASAVRKEIAAAIGSDGVRSISLMSTLVATSIGGRGSNKLMLVVSNLLGGLGLLLAIVGVYSVVSLGVTQRGREIAVRRALGARSQDIVLEVLRQGMRPVLFGAGLGLASALFVTRGISSLLFEVTSMNPLTISAASIGLLLPASVACILPAIRVLANNPADTLRHQ